MNFHVGQKVVCVDAKPRFSGNDAPDRLKHNGVYTVTGFDGDTGDLAGIFLAEVANKYIGNGFFASRFRPLVTRKTDISIFKRMLIPAPEKVRV